MFSSLQDLVPPFNIPAFRQYLYATNIFDLGLVETKSYEDFDYKVSAHYNNHILDVRIERNELDVKALSTEYRDLFSLEDMLRFPYSLEDFKRGFFEQQMSLLDLNVENTPVRDNIACQKAAITVSNKVTGIWQPSID